jgi:4-hydroxythreonine-4-phosphate dehydrogenase
MQNSKPFRPHHTTVFSNSSLSLQLDLGIIKKMMKKRVIAITMGDAGGIGPEVALKAATSDDIRALSPVVIIGDRSVLSEAAVLSGIDIKEVNIVEPYKLKSYRKGLPSTESGLAAYYYIKYALQECLRGDFSAMVTAPISKEALHLAGLKWPGHTEMLAEMTDTKRYAMMLVGGPLRVILVTTHIALRKVPEVLTEDAIYEKILLAQEAAMLLGIKSPVIAVAGLNPHCGEGGMFGDEDEGIIRPAIEKALSRGIQVKGPVPPDIVFRLAYTGSVDIVVSMYHDQGLIPLKMIAFDSGVNVTVGLPVIRTSPDHGTAYDIAWSDKANPQSMIEAIKLAVILSEGKKI